MNPSDVKYHKDTKITIQYPLINLDDLVQNNIITRTELEYKSDIRKTIFKISGLLDISRTIKEYKIKNDESQSCDMIKEYTKIIGYCDFTFHNMSDVNKIEIYFGNHNIYTHHNTQNTILLPIFKYKQFMMPTVGDEIYIRLHGKLNNSYLSFHGVTHNDPDTFIHYISHKSYYMHMDDYILLYRDGYWFKQYRLEKNINREKITLPHKYKFIGYFYLELSCGENDIQDIIRGVPGISESVMNTGWMQMTCEFNGIKREYYIKNEYMDDVKLYLSKKSDVTWRISENNVDTIDIQDYFNKKIMKHITHIEELKLGPITIDIT
jgi:hypothetical protein